MNYEHNIGRSGLVTIRLDRAAQVEFITQVTQRKAAKGYGCATGGVTDQPADNDGKGVKD